MFCQAGKVLFKKASLPAFSSSFSQLHSLQESEMEPAQLNTFYSLLKLFLAEFSSVFFSRKKKSQINFTRWWHWPQPRNFPGILPIWKNKVILTLLIWFSNFWHFMGFWISSTFFVKLKSHRLQAFENHNIFTIFCVFWIYQFFVRCNLTIFFLFQVRMMVFRL